MEIDAGKRDGLTSIEREEMGALRRENRRSAGGRRHPQACDGFLRDGDPVNVDPFIEAEKSAGHNVKRTCGLLKVG
ncbi:hypothetical protein ABT272_42765 [Streptomyces sp900105245]|uniref:Uncharacterized protein n=1 Tax=Streptomyces sp. 900105245 TaxID=3154379 RepID=A0ABV1UMA2_9ACTN